MIVTSRQFDFIRNIRRLGLKTFQTKNLPNYKNSGQLLRFIKGLEFSKLLTHKQENKTWYRDFRINITNEEESNLEKTRRDVVELLDRNNLGEETKGTTIEDIADELNLSPALVACALSDELNKASEVNLIDIAEKRTRYYLFYTFPINIKTIQKNRRAFNKERDKGNILKQSRSFYRFDFPNVEAIKIINDIDTILPRPQADIVLSTLIDSETVFETLNALERDGVLKRTSKVGYSFLYDKFNLSFSDRENVKKQVRDLLVSAKTSKREGLTQEIIEKQCRITNAKAFIALSDLIGEGLVDYKTVGKKQYRETFFFSVE